MWSRTGQLILRDPGIVKLNVVPLSGLLWMKVALIFVVAHLEEPSYLAKRPMNSSTCHRPTRHFKPQSFVLM